VVVLERANVRAMDLEKVPEPADLAVVDVSFISLMAVLPRIAQLLRAPEGKPIIALVKPQFEASREHVGKGSAWHRGQDSHQGHRSRLPSRRLR
jgi:23S rRNA (cytidine1920-2'-O)/16S rRNA (cytidine1409-2'-O)-methyltransferase